MQRYFFTTYFFKTSSRWVGLLVACVLAIFVWIPYTSTALAYCQDAQESEEIRVTFSQQAPSGWQRAREASFNQRATRMVTNSDMRPSPSEDWILGEGEHFEWAESGSKYFRDILENESNIACVNPQYFFQLQKKDGLGWRLIRSALRTPETGQMDLKLITDPRAHIETVSQALSVRFATERRLEFGSQRPPIELYWEENQDSCISFAEYDDPRMGKVVTAKFLQEKDIPANPELKRPAATSNNTGEFEFLADHNCVLHQYSINRRYGDKQRLREGTSKMVSQYSPEMERLSTRDSHEPAPGSSRGISMRYKFQFFPMTAEEIAQCRAES